MLFPENIGSKLSSDEVSLSKGELKLLFKKYAELEYAYKQALEFRNIYELTDK